MYSHDFDSSSAPEIEEARHNSQYHPDLQGGTILNVKFITGDLLVIRVNNNDSPSCNNVAFFEWKGIPDQKDLFQSRRCKQKHILILL